ncbi:hypothetical protein AB2B38_009420 [Balneola sp. MJW-20]|uniref:hypothetical protein n=1 Tax=Gracilimonas aurantiaca TaxID=3234185 RepID=UPI0034666CB5
MILRTLLISIIFALFIQHQVDAQIRTTYDKNTNIQGGLFYNTSPDYNKYWNYGYSVAISREREFNSGWFVLGGLRFGSISFSDDDYRISNNLPDADLTYDNSEIYQLWGAIKYEYPILSPRLKAHGLFGIHVSIYQPGSVEYEADPNFNVAEENSGYGGLLLGGGLGFDLIPNKLRLFAETQYHLGSTAGNDTIFIGMWPVEFGISF